ncbi:MAG: hypothetical protein WC988_00170 [Patescibacteria group bacterium]
MDAYLRALEQQLEPLYHIPHVVGGHEISHVRMMLARAKGVLEAISRYYPGLDPADDGTFTELLAAIWWHNVDRVREWKVDVQKAGGDEPYVLMQLADSPFENDARARIAYAVANHSQRECQIGEHPWLLVALMDLDKMVRLFPLNVIEGAQHQLEDNPIYDPEPEHLFDYKKARRSLWRAFMWNLEWVPMLSCDEVRALIEKAHFRAFIDFLRALGADIAEREGVPNGVEGQIELALGEYYQEFACS